MLRFRDPATVGLWEGDDLEFLFVCAGTGSIAGASNAELATGDALSLPPGPFVLSGSPGLHVLEVTVCRPQQPNVPSPN